MTTTTEYRTIEISTELLQKNIERSHCARLASSLFGSELDSHVDLEVSHFLQMVAERISNCSDFYFLFLYGMEQIPSLSGTVARIKQVHNITLFIDQLESLRDKIYHQLMNEVTATSEDVVKVLSTRQLPKEWMDDLTKKDALSCNRQHSHRQRILEMLWKKLYVHFTITDYSLFVSMIYEIRELTRFRRAVASFKTETDAFMKKTTIQELMGYPRPLCCIDSADFDFSETKMGIQANPSSYTLEELNNLKNEYCEAVHLPSSLLILTRLEKSEAISPHFFAVWKFPTVLASKFIQHTKMLNDSFYSTKCILSIQGPQEFHHNISKPAMMPPPKKTCTLKTVVKYICYTVYVCFSLLLVLTFLSIIRDYQRYVENQKQGDLILAEAMEYSELKKIDLVKALIEAEKHTYYLTFYLLLIFVVIISWLAIACLLNLLAHKSGHQECEQELHVEISHHKTLASFSLTDQQIDAIEDSPNLSGAIEGPYKYKSV